MRVLAWLPQPLDRSPGQRFRLEQWAPHLEGLGIEIAYAPFAGPELTDLLARPGRQVTKAWGMAGALGRRLLDSVREKSADLVYIFREDALLGPALAARLLVARSIPFVFDFDDAVFLRYVSPANGLLANLRFPGKTAALCRHARQVLAGNSFLEAYARQFNERVSVVPTTIDTQRYLPRPRKEGVPVVGWSGSYSTVQYLDLVRPVLERLARRRSFRVRVVGGTGFSVPGVEVECLPWRSETEVEDIGAFDVGIMPLPDDPWTKGKCGLKALQYMALGVPPIVSPVGVNTEIVEHGRNGLLAQSEEDWLEHLDRVLGNESLRKALGREARRTVEARYSASVVAPRVAQLLREARP